MEIAQNGARREAVPDLFYRVRRALCASEELAQNGTRREKFLTCFIVGAAPFALLCWF